MTDEEAALLAEALLGIPEGSIEEAALAGAAAGIAAADTLRPPPPLEAPTCAHCSAPATLCEEHAKQAIESAFSDDAAATGAAAIRTAERKLRGDGHTIEQDAEALALVIRRAWPEVAAQLARLVLETIEGDPT
jgi:hypothetical protein